MSVARLAAMILALAGSGCAAGRDASRLPQPPEPSIAASDFAAASERGRLFTSQTCAGCHATGLVGASPMAEATPFREIVKRYPLDQLEESFAEGLVTSHQAMPAFVFRASEIDDLIAYLETVKAAQ